MCVPFPSREVALPQAQLMLAVALLRAERELGAGIDGPILEVPKSMPFIRFIQLLAPLKLISAKNTSPCALHQAEPYHCTTACSRPLLVPWMRNAMQQAYGLFTC
jgi:hypothetical protein